jgi:hypothetical protein
MTRGWPRLQKDSLLKIDHHAWNQSGRSIETAKMEYAICPGPICNRHAYVESLTVDTTGTKLI